MNLRFLTFVCCRDAYFSYERIGNGTNEHIRHVSELAERPAVGLAGCGILASCEVAPPSLCSLVGNEVMDCHVSSSVSPVVRTRAARTIHNHEDKSLFLPSFTAFSHCVGVCSRNCEENSDQLGKNRL